MERVGISAKIDLELRAKIDLLCRDGDLTISDVLTRALNQYFFKGNDTPAVGLATAPIDPAEAPQPGFEDDADFPIGFVPPKGFVIVPIDEGYDALVGRIKALEAFDLDETYADLRRHIEGFETRSANVEAAFRTSIEAMGDFALGLERVAKVERDMQELSEALARSIRSEDRNGQSVARIVDTNFEGHEKRLCEAEATMRTFIGAIGRVEAKVADVEAWISLEVELAGAQGLEAAPPPVVRHIEVKTPALAALNERLDAPLNVAIPEPYDAQGAPTPEHASAIDRELEAAGFGSPTPPPPKPKKAHDKSNGHAHVKEEVPAIRMTWTHRSLKNRMRVRSRKGHVVFTLIDNKDGTWTLQTQNGPADETYANLPAKELAKLLNEHEMQPEFAEA